MRLPELEESSTSKDSRMLWRSGCGTFLKAVLPVLNVVAVVRGAIEAGFEDGAVWVSAVVPKSSGLTVEVVEEAVVVR